MGLFLIINKKDIDIPELREDAVAALTVIVECCDRNVVDTIMQGVERTVTSDQPG